MHRVGRLAVCERENCSAAESVGYQGATKGQPLGGRPKCHGPDTDSARAHAALLDYDCHRVAPDPGRHNGQLHGPGALQFRHESNVHLIQSDNGALRSGKLDWQHVQAAIAGARLDGNRLGKVFNDPSESQDDVVSRVGISDSGANP